ncbi:MAG: permease [Bacillota bacterium]|nr:permease [Bacillota bacterium]MDW7683618.1 permease [Bacillota bacterium]
MKNTLIIITLVVLALALSAFVQGGTPQLGAGMYAGVRMFIDVLPLLVAAFAVSGLVQVLINPERVGQLLGKGAGLRGILLGSVAGGLMPGGPYAYYPIGASFVTCGAEAPTLMAFVVAKSLWDFARFPLEVAILGVNVAVIRFVVTFAFPFFAALLTQWLYPDLTKHFLPVVKEGEKK